MNKAENDGLESLQEQIKAKDKLIKELLEKVNACPDCGCTELLCGFRGYNEGCASEFS